MIDLVILGTGNTDIIKLIESINNVEPKFKIHGFLDSNKDKYGKFLLGYPILGGDEMLRTEFQNIGVVINFVVKNRFKYMEFIESNFGAHTYPSIVHPSVNLNHVSYGFGNVIYENVAFATNVFIGNFNIIYPQSSIAHEVNLGDNVLIAANVTVGARTNVGNNVTLGNSSTLNLGISICDDTFLGVGSVVINSLIESGKYFGNPARRFK
ncbi:MAG: hypothetical protein FJX80_00910 [Bacteroidetes bacterium]|nr:hypothetical protein [Bacteroidota bacterium]